MATPYQIADAFSALGRLWAGEQAEGDDDGVGQVEQLTKLLRDFQAHEAEENDSASLSYGIDCCC